MAETLFGYTIDEDEGRLVVTVSGLLAEGAILELRQRVESGERWPARALMSSMLPLGRLLSDAVRLASRAVEVPPSEVVDEALSQQVDQTLAAFTEQLAAFGTALAELESAKSASPSEKRVASPGSKQPAADQSSRRRPATRGAQSAREKT